MSTASQIEQEMLALINAERTARGLNPLQLETQLNDSSEDHSTWMLNTDTFSHTGSGGSSATQRMQAAGFDLEGSWRTGENIAWQSERGAPGISDDVAQLHQNLMNSPGHRANILNPDFKYIGIGIETGDMQGFDAVMVTQNFATTDGAVMLDDGNPPTPPVDEVVQPDDPAPDTDTSQPEQPETETPDTEVAEPETPGNETPDTDVTDPEEPVTETPDVDTAEPDEPSTEAPDTDVSDPKSPDTETPDTDVAEPEKPDTGAPDIDVAEPTPETPDAEEPDGCFDVAAFLAELEAFLNNVLAQIDQFDWKTDDMTPADMDEDDMQGTDTDDMDIDEAEDTDLTEAPVDDIAASGGNDDADIYMFNFCGMDCMIEAA